eukprot:6355217-Prymnesium_polylepis.1
MLYEGGVCAMLGWGAPYLGDTCHMREACACHIRQGCVRVPRLQHAELLVFAAVEGVGAVGEPALGANLGERRL